MLGLMLTTKNQLEDTKKTLASLETTTNLPYKLVIIDNASTDGTVPFLQENGYQLIANKQTTCGTIRLNQGLHYLLSDSDIRYIGWIHNDMTFYSKWLERLVDHLTYDNRIGKLGAESLHLFGPDDPVFAEKFMLHHKYYYQNGNTCPWVMPREVIEKVGLFDERFVGVGGYEDWDYNNRVRMAGYEVKVTLGSMVWHKTMGTRAHYDESDAVQHNKELYYQKWGAYEEIYP